MFSLRGVRLLMDRVFLFDLETTGAQRPVVFYLSPVIPKANLHIIEPIRHQEHN
jgi:hypothetical protein